MTEANQQLTYVKTGYEKLQAGDLGAYLEMLPEKTSWHLVRPLQEHTVVGRDKIGAYLTEAALASPEDSDIRLDGLASDGNFAFAVHTEGAGTRREHRHVLFFEFEGGEISHTWELTLGGPENQHGVSTNMIPSDG